MAYQYSTQLVSSWLDLVVTKLNVATPKLQVLDENSTLLAELPFTAGAVDSKTDTQIVLKPPETQQVVVDGVATTSKLIDGNGELIVSFDVGSNTVNPSAVLILNSINLYAGGALVVTSLTIAP